MSRRLQAARRELERLEWDHARALRVDDADRAFALEPQIRDARWLVDDCETAQRTGTVRAAHRTALVLDIVLGLVAALVMAFSLGNIREFAAGHGVVAPLPWLLAPMVDLALIGTLSADAFLSRNDIKAGRWAAALRWFAGLGTLVLNAWDAVVSGAPGDVLVHAVPPLLLMLLAEAAPHYRRGAAAAVEKVRTNLMHDLDRVRDRPATEATLSRTTDTLSVSAAAAGQSATAPADDTAPAAFVPAAYGPGTNALDAGADDVPAARRPVRTTPAAPRARQTPGAGKAARPVRTEDELLADLHALRVGADRPLSQRAVLAALGIGTPRLRALLADHGLTLDPLPAPAPLHLVDADDDLDQQQQPAAAAL